MERMPATLRWAIRGLRFSLEFRIEEQNQREDGISFKYEA